MFPSYANNFTGDNGVRIPSPPLSSYQQQVQFSFVESMENAKSIPVQYNTLYILVNKMDKEVYIKQLNRDGLIEFNTYKDMKVIEEQKQQQNTNTENESIKAFMVQLNNRIDDIEKRMIENKPMSPNPKPVNQSMPKNKHKGEY